MAYVPPKKQRHFKPMIIIVITLIVAIAATWGYHYRKSTQPKEWDNMTICGFDEEKTKELLHTVSEETYTIRDYQFYGESLNLFAQEYRLGESDDVKRKSITLHNLCNEEKITYTMEESADRQIDLVEPQEGFYALSIHVDQKDKQLVYAQVLHSEAYYTVRRNGKVKKITLIADASIAEPALSQNTLFLQIEEVDPTDDVADVFIDPYGDRMINGYLQSGGSANGIKESEEMQAAAAQLKQDLEGYGLRVVLAKENADDVLGYYGSEGIMRKAYDSHAKYYIELGMNSANEVRYGGTEIYHSNVSSATMANALMYALKRNTALTPSNAYSWSEHSEGVGAGAITAGKDGRTLYDMMPALRESGGRISGAAAFSDAAKANEALIQQTNSGMQGVSVNFIYLTNQEDVSTWNKEKEKIIATLAEAFAAAIHVEQ